MSAAHLYGPRPVLKALRYCERFRQAVAESAPLDAYISRDLTLLEAVLAHGWQAACFGGEARAMLLECDLRVQYALAAEGAF